MDRIFHPLHLMLLGIILSSLSIDIYGYSLVVTLLGIFMTATGAYQLFHYNSSFKATFFLSIFKLTLVFLIVYKDFYTQTLNDFSFALIFGFIILFIIQIIVFGSGIEEFAKLYYLDYRSRYILFIAILNSILMLLIYYYHPSYLLFIVSLVILALFILEKLLIELKKIIFEEVIVKRKKSSILLGTLVVITSCFIMFISFFYYYQPKEATLYLKEPITDLETFERLSLDVNNNDVLEYFTDDILQVISEYESLKIEEHILDNKDERLDVTLIAFYFPNGTIKVFYGFESLTNNLHYNDTILFTHGFHSKSFIESAKFLYDIDKQTFLETNHVFHSLNNYSFNQSLNFPLKSINQRGFFLITTNSNVQYEESKLHLYKVGIGFDRVSSFINFPFKEKVYGYYRNYKSVEMDLKKK